MSCVRSDLNKGWVFWCLDDSKKGTLPARTFPTQVHLDLLENKKIPDPSLNLNELVVKWVAEKTWVYKKRFKRPENSSFDNAPTTDLVLEGLDTFATVTLNGVQILKTDNMFISHRIDISGYLENENDLEIEFESTVLRGRQLLEEHAHEHQFYVRQTEMSRVPVRSAQYNWGWDWGPITLTMGPWKPIYLEQYSAKIEDLWVQYELSADLQTVSGTIFAALCGSFPTSINLAIMLDGVVVVQSTCPIESTGRAQMAFRIDRPSLWNPFGFGQQTRYRVEAVLDSLDKRSIMIGFRRAELIQSADKFGKSFYFRINGVDIFCGGSCWIPADSFLSRVTPERYREWMTLVKQGNQNMVRIWGGGIYEHDALYDACDELGILLWQDFGFACASYPTYPEFLKSVEQEARQNLRRLRSHPSLVIWAGSNEDYQVQERYKLDYDFEDKDPESWLKTNFPARYLYEYMLPKIVSEEDLSVAYHPTSPWGDGKHSADPTVGDKHQWDIWHGAMNRYQEAPELSARFISEFGSTYCDFSLHDEMNLVDLILVEAYPHLETIKTMITDPQQRYPGSMMMDFRNKAIDHERRMITYVAENFRVKYDLASYTHLTQVVQSETMKYAFQSWRREWGSRKCGGVLVWQLNDCWPTMSWAVVDYHLVKKPAFYAIQRAMKPLAVGVARKFCSWTAGHDDPTVALRDTTFDLWVTSSLLHAVQVELVVRFISIRSGQDLVPPITEKVEVLANGTTELLKGHQGPGPYQGSEVANHIDIPSYDPYVIHAKILSENGVLASDFSWPQPIKYLEMENRSVEFAVISESCVAITARLPIKSLVFEESKGTELSDNGFDLVPGEVAEVHVSGKSIHALRYTFIGGSESSIKVLLT